MKKRFTSVLLAIFFAVSVFLSPHTVLAEEKKSDGEANILISMFWPPSVVHTNDEQYAALRDAGIDLVLGAGNGVDFPEQQKKMLDLCEKYGLKMIVSDGKVNSAAETGKVRLVEKAGEAYAAHPSTAGYHMIDEPKNPNEYITMYRTLKEFAPRGIMNLNLLAYNHYKSLDEYMSVADDWLRLSEGVGYRQDYITYDLYPYPEAGGMALDAFLDNMEAVRRVGAENGVKTGTYLQSVGIKGTLRSPTESEMRYEANMALAFGCKQLSYFTWFLPTGQGENFTDAIMTAGGEKTDKFDEVMRINSEIHALGKTLVKLDATEVYTSKPSGSRLVTTLPESFPISFSQSSDVTITLLRDRDNGRMYSMIVNNKYNSPQKIKTAFADGITSIELISNKSGEAEPLSLDGGKREFELEAGGAVLLRLPDGFGYSSNTSDTDDTAEKNLAAAARITADSSLGDGYFIKNLNDRNRDRRSVWRTANAKPASIRFDFGEKTEFNRIDIYLSGNKSTYGGNMPKSVTVSYSDDGENWTKLATAEELVPISYKVPSFNFPSVSARFVRLELTVAEEYAELSEIEIYNDDGTVSPPETIAEVDDGAGEYKIVYEKAQQTEEQQQVEEAQEQSETESESASSAESAESSESDTKDSGDAGEKSAVLLPTVIAAAVLIIAAAVFVLLKKKK